MNQRVTLWNALEDGDPARLRLSALLMRALQESGASVQPVAVPQLRLGQCLGCYRCWTDSPGECAIRDDAQQELARAVASDTIIMMGRIRFGGYSSALKRIVERLLPTHIPYFRKVQGEFHHLLRYEKFPRIVVLGVADEDHDPQEFELFRRFVGRNAFSLHPPSYASEVVLTSLSDERILGLLRSALERSDRPLAQREVADWWPPPDHDQALAPVGNQRLLTLVGSQKSGASTSGAIADYLNRAMAKHGWSAETLVIKPGLRQPKGKEELIAAVSRANLICLTVPLIVDGLPYRPTLALEVLARHWGEHPDAESKHFLAISNCGLPEPFHNMPALAICQRFATQVKWRWAGGLAVGGGEALSSGVPLDARNRGTKVPATRLKRALDWTAAALAQGASVPVEAQTELNRSPIGPIPLSWWYPLYCKLGELRFKALARRLGLNASALRARPLDP